MKKEVNQTAYRCLVVTVLVCGLLALRNTILGVLDLAQSAPALKWYKVGSLSILPIIGIALAAQLYRRTKISNASDKWRGKFFSGTLAVGSIGFAIYLFCIANSESYVVGLN